MIKSLLNIFPHKIAYAHCDIPCGIYDPHNMQVGAHTVIRMTQMIIDVKRDDELKLKHDITRLTNVKELHSNLIETELMTLKNDYFKKEIVEKLEMDIENLFKDALISNTKARVGIDLDAAKETLELVMKISELFYKSKGFESKRVKAPYPTGMDIVVQS